MKSSTGSVLGLTRKGRSRHSGYRAPHRTSPGLRVPGRGDGPPAATRGSISLTSAVARARSRSYMRWRFSQNAGEHLRTSE